LAVASAAKGVALGQAGPPSRPLAAFGELGLTGELRTVGHPERRLEEAEKFGLRDVVHPGSARSVRHALRSAFAAGEPVAA
jgi:DNA repair protein RadA/Sms